MRALAWAMVAAALAVMAALAVGLARGPGAPAVAVVSVEVLARADAARAGRALAFDEALRGKEIALLGADPLRLDEATLAAVLGAYDIERRVKRVQGLEVVSVYLWRGTPAYGAPLPPPFHSDSPGTVTAVLRPRWVGADYPWRLLRSRNPAMNGSYVRSGDVLVLTGPRDEVDRYLRVVRDLDTPLAALRAAVLRLRPPSTVHRHP